MVKEELYSTTFQFNETSRQILKSGLENWLLTIDAIFLGLKKSIVTLSHHKTSQVVFSSGYGNNYT